MAPRRRRKGRARSPLRRFGKRAVVLLAVLLVAFISTAARLVWIQGLGEERFRALAQQQRLRRIALSAARGAIYDRNGRELALSSQSSTIVADPELVRSISSTSAVLAQVLQLPVDVVEGRLLRKGRFSYVARQVDTRLGNEVRRLRIPGVTVLAEPKRRYPTADLAASVIGFVGVDGEGLAGLELAYDSHLRGMPGEMTFEMDPAGRRIPFGKNSYHPAMRGKDLVLTIDSDVQFIAEDALKKAVASTQAKGGTVVVMEIDTGEVLAMANSPTFDPNRPAEVDPAWRRNFAITDVFEPGSAAKVVTAAGALEEKVTTALTRFNVPDRLKIGRRIIHDSHSHPTSSVTFAEIMAVSSNVGTIKIGQELGKEKLYEYFRRFGFGDRTGIGFPAEQAGILPAPSAWWSSSMGAMPIGQGIAVTPIQITSTYATVANGGMRVQPSLVRGLVDEKGDMKLGRRAAATRAISAETARTLTSILTGVVSSGTGTRAQVPGYAIAGKTGTAQRPREAGGGYEGYVASFVGFGPAGRPRFVCSVILDQPSPIWGGIVAAPVFSDVMGAALRRYRVEPGPPPASITASAEVQSDGPLPDGDGPIRIDEVPKKESGGASPSPRDQIRARAPGSQ